MTVLSIYKYIFQPCSEIKLWPYNNISILGTTQKVKHGKTRKSISFYVKPPSPPPPNKRSLESYCTHPNAFNSFVCIIRDLLNFIMFNFKSYHVEWYYHRNWLQTHFIYLKCVWDNLIEKYEMGSWPPPFCIPFSFASHIPLFEWSLGYPTVTCSTV